MEVKKIATLARLDLSEQEVEKFQGQLGKIIDYVDSLQDIDTDQIKPLFHPTRDVDQICVLREDEIQTKAKSEDILKNAPKSKAGSFEVPKVM